MPKRVFFTFHYQDFVDARTDVIRQHWQTTAGQPAAGFFDLSVWQHAKIAGDEGTRRLINSALERTSATCVLIGSETYARKWVRYEVMRSFRRGNHLLAVHVNHIRGKDDLVKPNGPNPLAHLGISYSENGRTATLWELVEGEWKQYSEIDGSATYETGGISAPYWGKSFTFSQMYREYDWLADDGVKNFASWVG
ncbi:MAG: TIR domain-containing protein [Chloroflexota bacterium]